MRRLFAFGLLFLVVLVHSAFKARFEAPPAGLLLVPSVQIQESPSYEEALRQKNNDLKLERAKIDYLIERIRKSPHTFVRNGDSYPGAAAAEHIAWKFRLRGDRVKSALDFIKYFATRSSESGKLYLCKLTGGSGAVVADGKTYPVCDLLYNELHVLEEFLQKPADSPKTA